MSKKYNLFVYGTLKKFERASYMLADANFVADAVTKPKYQLYSCGLYPALILGDKSVQGEIYEIDEDTKIRLDNYEGVFDGYYNFEEIELITVNLVSGNYKFLNKPIFAYLYQKDVSDFEKIDTWPCEDNKYTYNSIN